MKTGMEERVVLSQRTTEALKDLFRARFSPLRELRSPSAAWAWGAELCSGGSVGKAYWGAAGDSLCAVLVTYRGA